MKYEKSPFQRVNFGGGRRGVSSAAAKREKKEGRRGMFLFFLVLVFSVLTILFAFYGDEFRVRKIEVVGRAVSQAEVEAAIGGVKGKIAFFVRTRDLVMKLRSSFPDIYEVSVKVKLPNRLIVNARAWPIFAMVQGEDDEVWYFLNRAGRLAGTVPEGEVHDELLKVVLVGSGVRLTHAEAVVQPTTLEMIHSVDVWLARNVQRKIYGAKIMPAGQEVRVEVSGDFEIWLDDQSDVSDQMRRFASAYEKHKDEIFDVDYFDLRVPDRVFVLSR